MYRVSAELWKHEWNFGKNAVGTQKLTAPFSAYILTIAICHFPFLSTQANMIVP